MKTEASRKPVPMEQGLAEVLTGWHAECAYNPARRLRLCFNQDAWHATDFAEQRNGGSHPSCSDASRDYEADRLAYAQTLCRVRHNRHTFGTLLKANGEDVATVHALMGHANVSVTTNTYVQAVTPAKRKAQRGINDRFASYKRAGLPNSWFIVCKRRI